MPKVWRSIEYLDHAPFEGAVGPSVYLADDSQRVDRPIQLLDYRNIAQATADFVGYPYIGIAPSGSKYISRILPHAYPNITDVNGLPYLFCSSLQRSEGMRVVGDTPQGGPLYERALVRLIYTSRTYKLLLDNNSAMSFNPLTENGATQINPLAGVADEATLARYITRWPKPFFKTISVPRSLLQWVLEVGDLNYTGVKDAVAGPPIFESIGIPEPGIVREYTWHAVPLANVPEAAIAEIMGKVNQFTFDGKYAPETLLCEAPDITPYNSAIGEILVDIRYRFRQVAKYARWTLTPTPRGQNWFLRHVPRGGSSGAPTDFQLDYRLLTTNGKSTGEALFKHADFSRLFRPE